MILPRRSFLADPSWPVLPGRSFLAWNCLAWNISGQEYTCLENIGQENISLENISTKIISMGAVSVSVYKPPSAELKSFQTSSAKPVRALVFGLLISIVLLSVVSVILSVSAALLAGVDIGDEQAFTRFLLSNPLYMMSDVLLSLLVFYAAGKVIAHYAVGREYLIALLVSLITFGLLLYTLYEMESFSRYPAWYMLLSLLIVPGGIFWGARPVYRVATP